MIAAFVISLVLRLMLLEVSQENVYVHLAFISRSSSDYVLLEILKFLVRSPSEMVVEDVLKDDLLEACDLAHVLNDTMANLVVGDKLPPCFHHLHRLQV